MPHGHAWTIGRHFLGGLGGRRFPPSRLFRVTVPDAHFGQVELSGRLSETGSDELLLLIHGLGGSSQSSYLLEATQRAVARGLDVLRLNLRGADRLGHDLFHAGIGQDLRAVLQSPSLRRYQRRYLFGFSIGGHVCLKCVADHNDMGVAAAAAIGAPLHLEASAACFDAQPSWPYRRHVLAGLLEMVEAFAARHQQWPIDLAAARRVRRMRDFDESIIAPRFGFEDASDYYAQASAAPVLHRIAVPTLLVHAGADPMVPCDAVRPFLRNLSGAVSVIELSRGGHVAFPKDVSLGQRGPLGIEAQTLTWLLTHGRQQ